MAKGSYSCPVCGKEVMVLGANRRDVEGKISYYVKQGKSCTECSRAEELKAAQRQAQELGLPPLEGTPKQRAWAESIRSNFLSSPWAKEDPGYEKWLKTQTFSKVFIDFREEGLLRYYKLENLLVSAENAETEEKKMEFLAAALEATIGSYKESPLYKKFLALQGEQDVREWREDQIARKMASEKTIEEIRAIIDGPDVRNLIQSNSFRRRVAARALEIKEQG